VCGAERCVVLSLVWDEVVEAEREWGVGFREARELPGYLAGRSAASW
jgi:hypothetical protein